MNDIKIYMPPAYRLQDKVKRQPLTFGAIALIALVIPVAIETIIFTEASGSAGTLTFLFVYGMIAPLTYICVSNGLGGVSARGLPFGAATATMAALLGIVTASEPTHAMLTILWIAMPVMTVGVWIALSAVAVKRGKTFAAIALILGTLSFVILWSLYWFNRPDQGHEPHDLLTYSVGAGLRVLGALCLSVAIYGDTVEVEF